MFDTEFSRGSDSKSRFSLAKIGKSKEAQSDIRRTPQPQPAFDAITELCWTQNTPNIQINLSGEAQLRAVTASISIIQAYPWSELETVWYKTLSFQHCFKHTKKHYLRWQFGRLSQYRNQFSARVSSQMAWGTCGKWSWSRSSRKGPCTSPKTSAEQHITGLNNILERNKQEAENSFRT